jgi:hypothetical protein
VRRSVQLQLLTMDSSADLFLMTSVDPTT